MRAFRTSAAAATELYNFWRDAANPRGLWRRTTLDSYRTDAPEWEVVIDVDELAAAEDENWVWAGAKVIEPDHSLALISLSRGGSDAAVVREFDMRTGEFVVDGFEVPEAKTQISWEDENTVLIGTDWGEDSLTESGYPRLVKRWRRGTPLDEAETLFSGRTPTCSSRRRGTAHRASSERCSAALSTSSTTRSTSCATASSSASTRPPTPRCRLIATGC